MNDLPWCLKALCILLPLLILFDTLERLVLALLRRRLLLLARPRHLGQLGIDLRLVGLAGGFLNLNDTC